MGDASGGPNDVRIAIANLRGEIQSLSQTIDGRLNMHGQDIASLKMRMKESEDFRVEMRSRWDHFDGVQESEKAAQAERHQQNLNAINSMGSKIALGMLVVGILGLIIAAVSAAIAYQAGVRHARVNTSDLPTSYEARR
jgi:hypothetical protein